MRLKQFITALLGFLLLGALRLYAQPTVVDFEQEFRKNFDESIAYLKQNKGNIKKIIAKNHQDLAFVIAVAFPEMVRYGELKNQMEMASLAMLYTKFGSHYANFSVGRMQMKPVFVENLEKYVVSYNLSHKYGHIIKFAQQDVVAQRQERIRRLDDWLWQLHYLSAFVAVVNQRFATEIDKMNRLEHLSFLATTYNKGFESSFEAIQAWEKVSAFPYGARYKGNQYNYASIACYFYQKYGHILK